VTRPDSVHISSGPSSDHRPRPPTGGLPVDQTGGLVSYVALPRSQYYAPSATLGPLQPQVVQSSGDRSQRFPRSRHCPLHSGLGRSWTPVRCALHPRRDPYACTPLAGTVRPMGRLAQSVLEPSYTTTHAILISWRRVHAVDALNGASSRRPTGIQAGGLRVRMRCRPLPLVLSGFRRVVPPCPAPAELASGSLGNAPGSTGFLFPPFLFYRSSTTVTCFVAHRTGRKIFTLSGSSLSNALYRTRLYPR
jgi:hypothetical protein